MFFKIIRYFCNQLFVNIIMKKRITTFLLGLISLSLFAQDLENIEVSIITCDPGTEIYEAFGHTAIRIYDKTNPYNYDVIYNYGVFDFYQDNFIARFVKGQTDYTLACQSTRSFFRNYKNENRSIYEQTLNLTEEQKKHLIYKLEENALPENCEYRYNFFFDNCATRPYNLIKNEQYTFTGKIPEITFREMIMQYSSPNYPWGEFGINLLIGAPADRPASIEEQNFIPFYLKTFLENYKKDDQSIVSEGHYIYHTETSVTQPPFITPTVCFSIILIIVIILTFVLRNKEWNYIIDVFLFTFVGILGCVVFYVSFCSEHPCVFPNYNIIWANPLQLLFGLSLLIKPLRKYTTNYHFFNEFILFIYIFALIVIPQYISKSAILIIFTLLIRSEFVIGQKLFVKNKTKK